MKLTFCGAAGQVTGSCYLLETDHAKIVIDCGLFQGTRMSSEQNYDSFPFDPSQIDTVVVTHAHLDHCGRLPKLVQEGFSGRIIATKPTIALVQLTLEDSLDVLTMEARFHDQPPLYTTDDLLHMNSLCEGIAYRSVVDIGKGVTVEFFDAGHILGSSMIVITADGKKIAFSGDCGNMPTALLNPRDSVGLVDYLVLESTYGGRDHEDHDTRLQKLKSAIEHTIAQRGVLLIPAFAIERTQEIIYHLNTLFEQHAIPPVSVFVDSPLAIHATRLFRQFLPYLNQAVQEQFADGDDTFFFQGLHMTLTSHESKAIHHHPAPKVIIAGSGMAHGGRIVHHITDYISHPHTTYLIVGYQVEGSLGRQLQDGARTVHIQGKTIRVHARIETIAGFSAHADQPQLLEVVQGAGGGELKHVFLTHGEESQANELQHKITDQFAIPVTIPQLYDSIDLS